ncbi:Dolichol-phosphate mannosyltransferase subunit 3 [Yarrowia sp. B02]|nr:Dolichol-phosphate mannosyltransferase subunit 3 [Yarrowia sp. B02]
MTKATETAFFFVALIAVYAALWFGFIPVGEKIRAEIVPLLPFWLLVSFGSYSLGTLGWDILSFNDKPEKYAELKEQIKLAKADLKSKGVSV